MKAAPLTVHGLPLPRRGDAHNYDAPCTRKQWRELTAAGWEYDAGGCPDEWYRTLGEQWHCDGDDWREWYTLEYALSCERGRRRTRQWQCSQRAHVTDRLIALRMNAVAHGEHPAYGNASEIFRLRKEIERERQRRMNACPARERAAQSTAVTTENAVAGGVREVAFADRRERAVRTQSA